MHLGLFDDAPLRMSEKDAVFLSNIEAWIVYGKPREPRYFFEFGEWAILGKHLDRLIRQGRVVREQGRHVRADAG